MVPDPLPNLPSKLIPTAPKYRLCAGYVFTQKLEGPWTDAEICVLPTEAEGCTEAVGIVHIDGARCIVFAAPNGRYYAATEVSCRIG